MQPVKQTVNVVHSTILLESDIIDIFVSPDISSNFEALKKAQKQQVKDGDGKDYWRGELFSMEQIIVPVQTSPIATAQPTVSLMLTVRSDKSSVPF